MGTLRSLNPWTRRWLYYYATTRVFNPKTHTYVGTMTKRLFFVSYHLIKWWHGEQELIQMARRIR